MFNILWYVIIWPMFLVQGSREHIVKEPVLEYYDQPNDCESPAAGAPTRACINAGEHRNLSGSKTPCSLVKGTSRMNVLPGRRPG
jgi:hypothetical protein